jgi:hypothetical protein
MFIITLVSVISDYCQVKSDNFGVHFGFMYKIQWKLCRREQISHSATAIRDWLGVKNVCVNYNFHITSTDIAAVATVCWTVRFQDVSLNLTCNSSSHKQCPLLGCDEILNNKDFSHLPLPGIRMQSWHNTQIGKWNIPHFQFPFHRLIRVKL